MELLEIDARLPACVRRFDPLEGHISLSRRLVAGENFVRTVAGLVARSGAALPVILLLAGPAGGEVAEWLKAAVC